MKGTMMALSYEARLGVARAAVDYLMGREAAETTVRVPNCPGWTVYNAAVHVGRVSVAWEEMIKCTPDDATARERAYETSGKRPTGAEPAELARWAHAALDRMSGDASKPCFFSMTGGPGTTGLWAWHAASELGVHRLDVEAALGHEHAISDLEAVDATTYVCEFFLPAMRRAAEEDPGAVTAELLSDTGECLHTVSIDSASTHQVTVRGSVVQVLLALWGRPHTGVNLVDGDVEVWNAWRQLPGKVFQFGTWD